VSQTFLALAATLLSITPATEVDREYPYARIDSIIEDAGGGISSLRLSSVSMAFPRGNDELLTNSHLRYLALLCCN
jgi:hypothetical protein